jgi:hypothetical protein
LKETLLAPALAVVSVDLKRALLGRRGTPLIILGSLARSLMLLVRGGAAEPGRGELISQYACALPLLRSLRSLFFGVGWALLESLSRRDPRAQPSLFF